MADFSYINVNYNSMEENLFKYFLGTLDKSETAALFERMKTDDELKADFIRSRNTMALSHLSMHSLDETEGKKSFNVFSRRLKKKKQHKLIRLIWRQSMVAAIFMALTFLATKHYYKDFTNSDEMNTLYVPAGQRARLSLHDGTEVWLNANSTLQYPPSFSGGKRAVSIIGEAFFHVAENREKPFIVSSQHVTMEVLGTQFNVYSYPGSDYIQADLVEGMLKVYHTNIEENAVILNPNERVTIKSEEMTVDKTVDFDHFLWKEGIYSFEDESLLSMIEKLELYFDVKIIVENQQLSNAIYTGKFRQRDGIDEILRIIQKIQNFRIEKDTKNNIITLK